MSDNFLYGLHAINHLLESDFARIEELWVNRVRQDKRIMSLIESATQHNIKLHYTDRQQLDILSNKSNHQGIIAKIKSYTNYKEKDLESMVIQWNKSAVAPFLLILDSITDPHNLGACLRTAEAAGIHGVIIPKDKSAPLNATVYKVACGAVNEIPVFQITNLARVLKMLKSKGIWIIGTTGDSKISLYDSDLTGSLALVMGSEGKGMRRLTKEHCDRTLHIPMAGIISSLNVSVATGVCLFEAVRQRK